MILNKRVDFERKPDRTKQGSPTLLWVKPLQVAGGLAGQMLTLVTVQALFTREPGSGTWLWGCRVAEMGALPTGRPPSNGGRTRLTACLINIDIG